MSDSPALVLQTWADKFEQQFPGTVAKITTSAGSTDAHVQLSLYFYYEPMAHYYYRLLRFEQAVDADSVYGFEVQAFRDDQIMGTADTKERFEGLLQEILFGTRIRRIIDQLKVISEVSENSLQAR